MNSPARERHRQILAVLTCARETWVKAERFRNSPSEFDSQAVAPEWEQKAHDLYGAACALTDTPLTQPAASQWFRGEKEFKYPESPRRGGP